MRRLILALTALAVSTSLAACGSRPLQVTAIQLGRALSPDHSVSEFATVFSPRDTIYISVLTAGGGSGTLSVRWTYGGNVVGEPKKRVADKDVAATEFALENAGGFPPGEYRAEVFLDGKPVGTKTFKVQ
jgi:hypothetical protein